MGYASAAQLAAAFLCLVVVEAQGNLKLEHYQERYLSPTDANYQKVKGTMVQYRPGDVLIAGMLRIHTRGTDEECSDILDDGFQALEAVNMIVDEMNMNSDVLPGIKLGTIIVNTCNTDTHALFQVVRALLPLFSHEEYHNSSIFGEVFSGVIGASSSAVSIQTASLLQIFKIPQVSMWSTHPDLSNKNRFPFFFRTVPSDAYQAVAIVALIRGMGWNYVSVVYEDEVYGIRGYREVLREASAHDICIAVALVVNRNAQRSHFEAIVNELWTVKEAKAVVVFTKSGDAEHLITAAHDNPATRSHFTWIGTDGWAGELPLAGSDQRYLPSLNGAVTLQPTRKSIPRLQTYINSLTFERHLNTSGVNSRNPWFPEYFSARTGCDIASGACFNHTSLNLTILDKIQNVADAALSIIYGLDEYHKSKCGGGSGLCRGIELTRGTNKLAAELTDYMRNKSFAFEGIHGEEFRFDENQDGPAVYSLLTYNESRREWMVAGSYNSRITWVEGGDQFLSSKTSRCGEECELGQARVYLLNSQCCSVCVPCTDNEYVAENGTTCKECSYDTRPSPTKDSCVPVLVITTRIDDPYGAASVSVAAVGILITIAIAATYWRNLNTAIVKASGKELCVFIWIGALLCFVNGIVSFLPASTASCMTSRILLALGPTLMYAALLVKTSRVVVVFRAKAFLSKQMKRFVRPRNQILFTAVICLVQALITGAMWFLAGGDDDIDDLVRVQYSPDAAAVRVCSDVADLLVFVGLVYPLLLIVTCTVLATANRGIPEGFNETQFVGFTMYATCVIWLAFIPIYIANENNLILKVATVAICLSLSAVVMLLCLFGYRCYVMIFRAEDNTPCSVMERSPTSRISQFNSQASNVFAQRSHVSESADA